MKARPSRPARRACAVVVLTMLLCVSTGAAADPETDEATARAKAADEAGRKHYNLREYEAAIADYRRAFDAFPDPLFLFNIAQSYRQLHDCENARGMYKNYLREKPDADNRSKVEEFIAEMDACVVATTTPEPMPPPSRSHRTTIVAGVATAAVGILVMGAGIYFSTDAAQRARQLEDACKNSCDGSTVMSIDKAGKDANRNAIASYAIGGVAVATGGALIMWGWKF